MRFAALRIDAQSRRWKPLFDRMWPAYRAWYLKEGDNARPSLDACQAALEEHMPELVPQWRRLCELAGGDELAARMLTLYRPPAYIFGCSQAVWSRDEPFLIRNYDYSPDLAEGLILHTSWAGADGRTTRVVGMNDCLWGLVDGVNEHGVSLSLTYGGREAAGDGFGIPIILRYVLQIARDADEAVAALRRVPSHMAYNVMVLDASGSHALVELAPDREPRVTTERLSANHQTPARVAGGTPPPAGYAQRTRTHERAALIARHLDDDAETPERFVERFADEPLHSGDYEGAFGTLYTAVYRPKSRRAEYIWPGFVSRQSIDAFHEGEAQIIYNQGQLEVAERRYDPQWPAEQRALEQSPETPVAADGHDAPWESHAGDWQRFLVDAPGDWQRYLPEFMRPPER